MNRRRDEFFDQERHEAKNRAFLCQYLNRPPFNKKENDCQFSPEETPLTERQKCGRRNSDYAENHSVRPKRKNSKRVDYYQPFQHIAYIEHIRKVQNLERERRARSTSPILPRISHLQKNLPGNVSSRFNQPHVKKIENHWKNLQIKKALQKEIDEKSPKDDKTRDEIVGNTTEVKSKTVLSDGLKQSKTTIIDVIKNTNCNLITGDLKEPEKTAQENLSNLDVICLSKTNQNIPRRCKSVPSIKGVMVKKVQNYKKVEEFRPNHCRSRPKPPHRPPGKGLIESIKRIVLYTNNENKEDDNGWSEDITTKFPKETRNAIAFMLNKIKDSPPNVPLQNSETQTSPTESTTNVAKTDEKDDKKIPCLKNILCEKGLHAGECSRSSRTKNLIVHRKEMWPGRAFRVTEKTSEASLKEPTKKDTFLSLMEPSRVSVKEAVEKLEPLLNGKPETSPRNFLSKMNGLNGHTNGDLNGCGDIITQNQQKGCWTIGLINSKYRYLTAETFGYKINANGSSLKKKQIWTLEPDLSNTADSVIYLRSHLDKYLAVDSFGNITCESEERDPGSKFQISVAEDGSGRWALRNVVRGYFLGSTLDKLTCTAKVPSDAEFWHVHLAARPQVNLRSVGRKRFAHLSENLDEIHVDANIPWGEDTLFTLEFRADEGGKYALHTCNNKYLSNTGKLVDVCNKDCLFSAEYHSGQLALRDRNGAYLSPIGSKAVLKTRSQTVTKDELFSLEDSLPQASFVAALNSKFVSVKQGVDVTANQDEISDYETFQLEFDWSTKRWYIRTMQDKYWTLETGGGIQAAGDKRSSNALFDLIWQGDGSVAFRANNGRYVMTKRSGHLYATSDTIDDNCKYYFYLVNRPILVLKCEQGFVGHKSSNNPKLECNKATYETIQVERSDKGVVFFKGQNGKYWHADSESVTADSDVPEGFYLELREPTRLCIKTVAGYYLTASKNGCFRLGDSSIENATQWEY